MNSDLLFAHGHNAFDLALVLFALLVMPLFAVTTGMRLRKTPLTQHTLIRRYWKTIARGWAVVIVLLGGWVFYGRGFALLGLDWPIGFWGQMGFAFVMVAIVAGAVQLLRLPKALKPKDEARYEKALAEVKIAPRNTSQLCVFLLVAVTAGIWEELLYRGFLIWFLTPYTGFIGAIILSSIMFGLAHVYQSAFAIVRTALIGLVLAIAFVASGSLWWLMAAHALLDVFGGLLAWRIAAIQRHSANAQAPA